MQLHRATRIPPRSKSRPSITPFKERIRLEWEGVASAWGSQHWWRFVEQAAQVCNDRLVELAEIAPGQRVLDIGTGTGEPAATSARRVGPRGSVLGIDLAPRMIEIARQRAEQLGLKNLRFRVGDAESLHLAPRTFDAVLSRWTLMLFEDLGGTLSRFRSLIKPGGHFAAGLWGHPSRVPMISIALQAAADALGIEPPSPGDGPGHLWTQGAEALEDVVRGAGFSDVRTESVAVEFVFPSPQVCGEFICSMAGPLKLLLDQQPAAVAERLVAAVVEAFEPLEAADGTVRLANETLVVAGRQEPPDRVRSQR